MTPPRHDAGHRLSDDELEAMLERAAEGGARRALSDVGLGGKDAACAGRAPCRHRDEGPVVRAESLNLAGMARTFEGATFSCVRIE